MNTAHAILLNNGKYFCFEQLNVEVIDIECAAASLAKQCRFGGHTLEFFSVAEHVVGVSKVVPPGFEREGLLHDIAESVMIDMPTPLKRMLPDYSALLKRLEAKLHPMFGIPAIMSPEVRHGDLVALATERAYIKAKNDQPWGILEGIEPDCHIAPRCLSPRKAFNLFMDRYNELQA